MSKAIAQAISLPWAPHAMIANDGSGIAASGNLNTASADSMKVGGVGQNRSSILEGPQVQRRTGQMLPAPMREVGLPHNPLPTIPAEDRGEFDADTLIGLAVAMDVLGTVSKRCSSNSIKSSVLEEMVQNLLHVGHLGGIDSGKAQGLVNFAASKSGMNRAQLCKRLSACMHFAQGAAVAKTPGEAVSSTPKSVAQSVVRLEDAAELVVKEAELLLDAHSPIEYYLA